MNTGDQNDEADSSAPFIINKPTLEREKDMEGEIHVMEVIIDKVKEEINTQEDSIDTPSPAGPAEANRLEVLNTSIQDVAKRKPVQNGSGEMTAEHEVSFNHKRRRIASERNTECAGRAEDGRVGLAVEDKEPAEERMVSSYRKPLYGISHKISDRRNVQAADQPGPLEASDRNYLNNFFQQRDSAKSYSGVLVSHASGNDPTLYSLIHKMLFTLNTLNSSMTQLHSKIDLLSLEVNKVKKHVNPGESVVEFLPPPEYQLNNAELKQVLEQSSSAGEFACRLLVQLFPEFFTEDEAGGDCHACGSISKRKLDSLHLQLLQNYVEVCYPAARSGGLWQAECLPQISDLFNRFWAQKEMENSEHSVELGNFYGAERAAERGYMDDSAQDEGLDSSSSVASDLVPDAQEIGEYLEEAVSPGEFSLLLLHRLFPELFDLSRLAAQHACYGNSEKQPLDTQRLQMIRKYTEIYFPEVQEDEAWLRQCVHTLDEELASIGLDRSETEAIPGDSYCSSSNASSALGSNDGADLDKSSRKSKKIWLIPVDFNYVMITPPDFEVPCPEHMLGKHQLKNIYESSLSIGNFASRLLVKLFPELFTPENLRKQYNCSGSLGKKPLDPVRLKLIRHYVQLMYPRAKCDKVWNQEFVSKLDERCRRRDTEQRRVYQQQRRKCTVSTDREEPTTSTVQPEPPKKEPALLATEKADRYSRNFSKLELSNVTIPQLNFPVPSKHLLTTKELKEIVQDSLSIGNFAARLLVRIFPELFTSENLRLQFNHSGACNKKQLDPIRLRLIRHYVEAVYPRARSDQVWHLECIPSIDERCRRPDRRKSKLQGKAENKKNRRVS